MGLGSYRFSLKIQKARKWESDFISSCMTDVNVMYFFVERSPDRSWMLFLILPHFVSMLLSSNLVPFVILANLSLIPYSLFKWCLLCCKLPLAIHGGYSHFSDCQEQCLLQRVQMLFGFAHHMHRLLYLACIFWCHQLWSIMPSTLILTCQLEWKIPDEALHLWHFKEERESFPFYSSLDFYPSIDCIILKQIR